MRRSIAAVIAVAGLIGAVVRVAPIGAQSIGDVASQAPTRAQAEAEARRAAERIRELRREADTLATQQRTLLGELRRLEVNRELRAEELARLQAELRATTDALARTEDEARRLEAEVLRQQPQVAGRLVELYKLGRAGYWRLLLNVDDIRSFGRAYRSVSTLARLDQDRVTAHRLTLASLTAARATLQTRRVEMRALETDAQAARLALERALAAYEQRLGDLDTRRDLNAQLTGELELAQQRLQATLGEIAASAASPTALPIGPFRGSLDWPVDGALAVPFGRDARSRFGTGVRHNGIEIAADEGRPVLAVHDGTVSFADLFTGYGHLVILDHGDQAYSLYGHLSSLDVQRGMTVGRGAVLGTIGRPPGGDAPRLYFELRIDARPVDPVEWLRKR
jgi:septal ring factor EnvC (AmiA/AmiB activator)